MTAPARKPRGPGAKYPSPATVEKVGRRLLELAKEAGIKVGGVECTRDGTIRVVEAPSRAPASAYDDWKKAEG